MSRRSGGTDGIFWGFLTVSLVIHGILFVTFSQWKMSEPSSEPEVTPVNVMVRAELVKNQPVKGIPDFQPVQVESGTENGGRNGKFPTLVLSSSQRPQPNERFRFIERTSKLKQSELISNYLPEDASAKAPEGRKLELRNSDGLVLNSADRPKVEYFPVDEIKPNSSSSGRLKLVSRPPTPPSIDVQSTSEIRGKYRLLVSETGRVESVEVIDSTGSVTLDNQLREWIRKWEYQPRGKSVRTIVQVAAPEGKSDA